MYLVGISTILDTFEKLYTYVTIEMKLVRDCGIQKYWKSFA